MTHTAIATRQRFALGYGACALAGSLWGTGFFFGKIALAEMSVSHMVLYRFLFACAVLAPLGLRNVLRNMLRNMSRHPARLSSAEWRVLLLASFLGFELIRRVPQLLHPPLMSLTNAISGIALVGSIVIVGSSQSVTTTVLGTIAIAASSSNVIGGFLLTDRMLRMFRRRR